jgi:hypothetical protein
MNISRAGNGCGRVGPGRLPATCVLLKPVTFMLAALNRNLLTSLSKLLRSAGSDASGHAVAASPASGVCLRSQAGPKMLYLEACALRGRAKMPGITANTGLIPGHYAPKTRCLPLFVLPKMLVIFIAASNVAPLNVIELGLRAATTLGVHRSSTPQFNHCDITPASAISRAAAAPRTDLTGRMLPRSHWHMGARADRRARPP